MADICILGEELGDCRLIRQNGEVFLVWENEADIPGRLYREPELRSVCFGNFANAIQLNFV